MRPAPAQIFQQHRPRLLALFAAHQGAPSVRACRRRWAHLLSAALGTRFAASDDLFVDHTLLVATAQLVAHAVLGLEPARLPARGLLRGEHLAAAGVHGLAEPGLFDWPADLEDGAPILADLARALADVDVTAVDHDILKIFYESAIHPDLRKQLGEFYTPDWLAEAIVTAAVDAPLRQHILDPSCGSGTFLFHAIRRRLAAAESSGQTADLVALTDHVRGIDLHPVAVALARVTYLLAVGKPRLTAPGRAALTVPVRLADALQWSPRTLDEAPDAPPERADLLIGNPPWLAFRFMSPAMQADFRELSQRHRLWHGADVATHQDLSALFVVRAAEKFLTPHGRLAFVMPGAALDRRQFAGFRGGRFDDTHLAFTTPWDLRRLRPHFFPISASVIFARRAEHPSPLPPAEIWRGRLPAEHPTWPGVDALLERAPPRDPPPIATSPYRRHFHQGAVIVPRALLLVEPRTEQPGDRITVRTLHTPHEKPPWKHLERLEDEVEPEFVFPLHLGETTLPYRTLPPRHAVLPLDRDGKLDQTSPGVARWWARASDLWLTHRSNPRLTLAGQVDYLGKLAAQLPIAAIRLVYTKSGMHLGAAILEDPRALVDHTLYWAALATREEAAYLAAILNSSSATRLVRPHMAFGKDERHIDKAVWALPIPRYDPADRDHRTLAELAAQAERAVAGLALDAGRHFTSARRQIRELLRTGELGREIEHRVRALIDHPPSSLASPPGDAIKPAPTNDVQPRSVTSR
ncbi:MAG: N-6 DNA methylase [Myxococcales bacterium]|nr:N-6 DNA methylase [Myxococcales bacterium]